MKLNRTNKKITSLLFAALMIISVFAGFMMPVMATGEKPEGGIISSRVICYAGNPVANASINVRTFVQDRETIWSGQTDADGNYTITGLVAGTYGIEVYPPYGVKLAPAFITDIVIIAGEITILNVTMEKGGIISGRVICYAGNPVANASINVRTFVHLEPSQRGWAQTDTDGNYTITGLAAGTYEIEIYPPYGVRLVPAFITDMVIIAGEITILNVTMEKGGIISGRVICYAGNPVANASIDVRMIIQDWEPIWSGGVLTFVQYQETIWGGWAQTDADGNYTTTGLAAGTYEIKIYPSYGINLVPAFITDIVVIAGEITILNVTMEKGDIISGRVLCYEGNPVANASINVQTFVQDQGTITMGWGGQTDADGNYTITGLVAGTYGMEVYPPWGSDLLPAFIADIVVIAGETTIVNVTMEKGGIISGKIVCYEGNPVADALIDVQTFVQDRGPLWGLL